MAIIVGSMPAVATFMRVYVSESALVKTLWSKIRGTNGDYSGKNLKPSFPRPDLATFGSPNVRGPGCYELTDPTVTTTGVIPDEPHLLHSDSIAGYHQTYAQPNSTERLVV